MKGGLGWTFSILTTGLSPLMPGSSQRQSWPCSGEVVVKKNNHLPVDYHPGLVYLFRWQRPCRALAGDRIRPYLSVREVYDDNIFRVRDEVQLKDSIGDDQLADHLTIYTVGMGLDYRWSRQGLGVQMRKDFLCAMAITRVRIPGRMMSGGTFP